MTSMETYVKYFARKFEELKLRGKMTSSSNILALKLFVMFNLIFNKPRTLLWIRLLAGSCR